MATELKTTGNHRLTRFWGGDQQKVQVTMNREFSERGPADMFFDHLHLTRDQAKALAADLTAWVEGKEQRLED